MTSVYSQRCATITTDSRTFTPQKETIKQAMLPIHPLCRSWPPLICFQALRICPCWVSWGWGAVLQRNITNRRSQYVSERGSKEEGIGERKGSSLAPAAGGTGKSWVSRARLPGQRFGWKWLLQPESEFHKAAGWRATRLCL